MKTSTLLRNAWALIEDPKHWTAGAFARTARGRGCDVTDPLARKFCALGALQHARHAAGGCSERANALLRRAARGGVVTNNDRHGHEAARKMYAEAIHLAEAEELAQRRGPGARRNRPSKETKR